MPSRNALKVDAFTVRWSDLKLYAFPLFNLILKMLVKIKRDRAARIIIVPFWPSQTWYPLLLELITSTPIIFEPKNDLLLSPCRSIVHPQADHLRLIAARVSGKPF